MQRHYNPQAKEYPWAEVKSFILPVKYNHQEDELNAVNNVVSIPKLDAVSNNEYKKAEKKQASIINRARFHLFFLSLIRSPIVRPSFAIAAGFIPCSW